MAKSDNSFPHGSCEGPHTQDHSNEDAGCGWVTADENSYYIKPYAPLSNATLTNAYLRGAGLGHANLSGANLSHADLTDANLNGSDLTGADLSYAYLGGTELTGATLSGVKANSSITCPCGKKWGTPGNCCGF